MNILFVGTPATPYANRACDIKLTSFANILAKKHNVYILNRYSHIKNNGVSISERIIIIEILKKYKIKSFLLFLLSILIEPFIIIYLKYKYHINILHIYSGHFFDFIYYRIIAFIIRAKIIYQYDEFLLGKETRGGYFRINSILVDNVGPKLWDASVCISDFLLNHAKKVNPKLKTIKLTPICDFSTFENINSYKSNFKYLLFCGSIGYFEIIDFIVSSYKKSTISKVVKLILVLSGDNDRIELFKKENPEIIVYHCVQYKELIGLYKGALALLIPLRNTIEDIARFPNKICEYIAAKGLIITTKYGEMSNYFSDNNNALVALDFTTDAYALKLDWLYNNLDKVNDIKETSYRDLKRIFDQDSNADSINDFISSI